MENICVRFKSVCSAFTLDLGSTSTQACFVDMISALKMWYSKREFFCYFRFFLNDFYLHSTWERLHKPKSMPYKLQMQRLSISIIVSLEGITFLQFSQRLWFLVNAFKSPVMLLNIFGLTADTFLNIQWGIPNLNEWSN